MPMMIQIAKKTSRFRMPQCSTRSAFERNLTANANSRKPKTILTVVSQPPERGNELSKLGNKANIVNGNANANPNPAIPMVNCTAPPFVDNEPASKDPRIGPVQENDTSAKVSAMKNIPTMPPTCDFSSALFAMLLGNVISNKPKKLRANTTKMAKKTRLSHTFVDMVFSISGLLESRKWKGM